MACSLRVQDLTQGAWSHSSAAFFRLLSLHMAGKADTLQGVQVLVSVQSLILVPDPYFNGAALLLSKSISLGLQLPQQGLLEQLAGSCLASEGRS